MVVGGGGPASLVPFSLFQTDTDLFFYKREPDSPPRDCLGKILQNAAAVEMNYIPIFIGECGQNVVYYSQRLS